MSLDTLRLIRNTLLRTALIAYLVTLFIALATVALWDTWSGLMAKWFHTNPEILGPLMAGFFTLIKFYYVFVLLVPALGLHWTIKVQAKKGQV